MVDIMALIQNLITKYKEKVKQRNMTCDDLIIQIDHALEDIHILLSDTQSFIEPDKADEWCDCNRDLFIKACLKNIKTLKKASNYQKLLDKQTELYDYANSIKQKISIHNDEVAKEKVPNAYTLIGDVEGRKLDEQQMACIVKEVHNHLVIAGAGTGKTTTIIGKIKFLLKSGKYKPKDILVLSFTNASATEMSRRINQETSLNIEASTFHKLGLNIITSVEGISPKITNVNLRKLIKDQVQLNIKNESYLKLLDSYLLYHRVAPKPEFEFQTDEEYNEYLHLNPPTTIQHEQVKSYGEMDIANFLFQNGIKYIYENPYKIDTRTSEYGQYIPDFYLPEYDIYIEYFGIDKDGKVPEYFKSENQMTPTQTYQASMKWKRETHASNGTVLIECYAFEKYDGTLLENLKSKLIANNVKLTPQSAQELWTQISDNDSSLLDGIAELFETIINLIKSNGYTFDTVQKLNIDTNSLKSNQILLSLIEPIYQTYCSYLAEHSEIDFNDMINKATEYVKQQKYSSPYKYVIVDEYQDISAARFSLLHNMRASNDFSLFCVGDDWQSIYRFAGSDIGYILNFEHYWGASEISKIETTYRFTKKLISISSNFIMQNPFQLKKNIQSKMETHGFALGEINGYTDKISINFLIKKLDDLPKNSSVFFIGRYSFDVKLLMDNQLLECKYNNIEGIMDIKYNKRNDLKMHFLTAHKAKGLQADYVFILNNKNSKMGFPSKMQNAPILDLLLNNCDQYPYEEERRLFYVALTRARKKVFLVTVKNQESEFVIELKKQYSRELKQEPFECPLCGGILLKRSGAYGEFLGCSNYKTSGCTYKRKTK